MEIYTDAVSWPSGWFSVQKTARSRYKYEAYLTWRARDLDLTAPDPSDSLLDIVNRRHMERGLALY